MADFIGHEHDKYTNFIFLNIISKGAYYHDFSKHHNP